MSPLINNQMPFTPCFERAIESDSIFTTVNALFASAYGIGSRVLTSASILGSTAEKMVNTVDHAGSGIEKLSKGIEYLGEATTDVSFLIKNKAHEFTEVLEPLPLGTIVAVFFLGICAMKAGRMCAQEIREFRKVIQPL